jgi:hypothetical protein
MPTFTRNILICHACPSRQRNCMGSCACLRDGRDIIDHAKSHDCPLERFAPRGMGDSVAWILQRMGIVRLIRLYREQVRWQRDAPARIAPPDCGCGKRREKLNEWVPYSPSPGVPGEGE